MENTFPVINVAIIIIWFGLTWWYAKSTSNLLRHAQEQVAAIQNQALAKTQEFQKFYAQIHQEIDERRQLEERLEGSEARFAAFMRHLPGIAVMRDVNGHYLFANETWEKFFGRAPEDWFNKSLKEVWPPDLAHPFQKSDQEVLKSGQPLETIETFEQDDGKHYWLMKRFPITTQDDQGLMIGGIGIDITARRQIEEALSQEKERYRILVEELPLGISIISKNGHYKYVNSAFVQMFGYTLAEVPHGRAWFARAFPDPQYRQQAISAWIDDLQPLRPSTPRPRTFKVTCKNGFEKFINFRAVSLSTGDRFVIYEDITTRHRAQEELKQSEFKYRLLVNQIPAIAFKGYADWSVDFFDEKVETLTGYPKEIFDSRQLRWCDLIPPEEMENVQRIFVEALRTNKSYVREHRIRKKNGEFAWVQCRGQIFCDAEGNVDFISGVTFDVTERKQAEEALRQSEEKYRLLVNTVPAVVFKGYADWNVDFFDEKIEELTGYSQSEFNSRRMKWSEVILEEDRESAKKAFVQALKTNRSYVREYRIRKKNGEMCWLQSRGKIICHPNGTIDYITGVFFDITKQKEMEEALRAERNRLETITRHMGAGLAVIDRDYRVVWANEILREDFGDCIGAQYYSTIHQSSEICPTCGVRDIFEAGLDKAVHEHQNTDIHGNKIWSEIITTPIQAEKGEVVAALQLLVPITERKRAEEALRKSENLYRLLAENVRDVIWTADLDQKITFVSPSAQLLSGHSPEEIMSMRLEDLFTGASLDLARQTLAEAVSSLKQGTPDLSRTWTLEVEIICKDGSTLWTEVKASFLRDAEGHPVRMLGVSRDIRKRKSAELALRRREAILKAVSFAAGRFLQSASWEEDIEEILVRLCQAVEASRAYIFKNSLEENGDLLTSQRYEWVAPTITSLIDDPQLQNLSWQKTGFGRWQEELSRNRFIAGHVKDFPPSEQEFLRAQDIDSILVVPIFTGQQWWGFIGFDECLREREWSLAELDALKAAASTLGAAILHERAEKALKESENKLRSLSCQLLAAQENERKRLAAELHDELGHALLTLKLNLESLENRLKPEQLALKKETRQIIRFLLDTIEEVRRLYLDLSPGDLEDLGLTSALEALIGDFAALQKGIKWTVHLENLEGLFPLPVQTVIYRVVQEALTNIGKHAKPQEISFAIKKDPKQVSFTIADTGKGFDMSRVFTSRKTLGLLAMEERVKILGGSFELWSQQDQGTRVSFTIPLEEAGN